MRCASRSTKAKVSCLYARLNPPRSATDFVSAAQSFIVGLQDASESPLGARCSPARSPALGARIDRYYRPPRLGQTRSTPCAGTEAAHRRSGCRRLGCDLRRSEEHTSEL